LRCIAHAHSCTHAQSRTHTYTLKHTHTHTHTHTYTQTHTHTHMLASLFSMLWPTWWLQSTHIHTHIHTPRVHVHVCLISASWAWPPPPPPLGPLCLLWDPASLMGASVAMEHGRYACVHVCVSTLTFLCTSVYVSLHVEYLKRACS